MIQLTDEEILHALEHCEDCVGCAHCIYTHKNVECNNTNDAVKLIHRLQDDLETCSNIEKQEKATNYELRTEIERLTEERDMYADDLYWKAEVRKREDFITELTVENAELQKQVNELRAENGRLHKIIVEEMVSVKAVMASKSCPTAMKMLAESVGCVQKDTAKEIFEWLEKHCFFNGFEIVEQYFRERYGVEVE